MEKEETISTQFICERKTILEPDTSLKLDGGIISLTSEKLRFLQPKRIANLSKIREDSDTLENLVSQRARDAYVASIFHADLTYRFSVFAQVTIPDKDDNKRLNKAIEVAKANPDFGLRLVSLNPDSLRVVVFADASFTLNANMTSQLGFVICPADKSNKANIVHYSSFKLKCVTWSELAAELFAVVNAFYFASAMCESISSMFGRQVSTNVYTDSKNLYDAIVEIRPTSEKRLVIDLKLLREAFEWRENDEVAWVPSEDHPADGMTKGVSVACTG